MHQSLLAVSSSFNCFIIRNFLGLIKIPVIFGQKDFVRSRKIFLTDECVVICLVMIHCFILAFN